MHHLMCHARNLVGQQCSIAATNSLQGVGTYRRGTESFSSTTAALHGLHILERPEALRDAYVRRKDP
jgi:hypothetical protein